MARVGVVIVTYRSAPTLPACLASLRTASAGLTQLVVVDNASDDDSAALAEAAGATVLRQPENLGYGAANNAGVAALDPDTEWVLYANPDTVWPAGTLDALVDRFDSSLGLLSPMLVNADGTRQAIVENDLTMAAAVLGMTRLRRPVRPRVPSGAGVVEVDWLHTAAALVPIDVVRQLGGFDERFFLFAEDADFCRRVRALGRRVAISTDVAVEHIGGSSFDAAYDRDGTAALRTRALATYIDKYQGAWARRVFGAVGTAVYGVARHRGQAREAWRALVR